MDRIENAKKFLENNLQDRETTTQLMQDRIGLDMVEVIKDEAERIASIRDKSSLSYEETIRACLFIGYLLRSHMERVDLNVNLPDEDIDNS